jgi:hypothetical protein
VLGGGVRGENVATAGAFPLSRSGWTVGQHDGTGIMARMLHTFSRWFLAAPRRLVQAGLCMFFGGGGALFAGLLGQLALAASGGRAMQLAERFPGLPTGWVPETALGYTGAATLVCWGVWAIGAGARQAREAGARG